jgi:hypothetical protein
VESTSSGPGDSLSSTLRSVLRRAQLTRDSVAEAAATTMLVDAYARGGAVDLSDPTSVESSLLFQHILLLPTALFHRLQPYVERLLPQLLAVRPSGVWADAWVSPLDCMVRRHAPLTEGDWLWRIYDALLKQATTPLGTRPADPAAASIGSSLSPPWRHVDGAVSSWRAMAVGRRTDSLWSQPNACEWSEGSILLFLRLLHRYGITHDEHGHDFVRGLILHGSPVQVAWWLSIPTHVHAD